MIPFVLKPQEQGAVVRLPPSLQVPLPQWRGAAPKNYCYGRRHS